jgi:hypothetical protein
VKRTFTLLIVAATLASCTHSSLSGTTTRTTNAPLLPATNASDVLILRDAPDRYVKLGDIRLDIHGMRDAGVVSRDPAVAAALREEAARLGADAIISVLVQPRSLGMRPDSHLELMAAHHVIGTAIRTTR